MRISSSMIFQNGVTNILDQQAKLAKTQAQMSSGKKVVNPSDDPTAAVSILQLQHNIDINNTYQSNINYAQSSLSTEESTLGNSLDLLQRIRELSVQANSGVMSDSDLKSISKEIQQDLNGILALANSQDGSGNYLFSGNRTTTKPFDQGSGGFNYSGDQGQRVIQIGQNRQTAITDSGYDVFQKIKNGNGTFVTTYNVGNTGSGVISTGQITDPTAWVPDTYTLTFLTPTTYEVRDSSSALITTGTYQSDGAINFNGAQISIGGAPAAGDIFTIAPSTHQDVFATVNNLITALNGSVEDPASRAKFGSDINQVLISIDQAMNHIDNVRADIGARLNAIDSQKIANGDFITASQTALSAMQDLDYTEAASRLSQQLLALQAAQQSFVKLQNLSLFNYIQ